MPKANQHPIAAKRLSAGVLTLIALWLVAGCTQTDKLGEPGTTTSGSTQPNEAASSTATTKQSDPSPEQTLSAFRVEGRYSIVEVEPRQVKLVWRDRDNQPLGQLEQARKLVEETGDAVVAVLNAGIYTPSQTPAGLHIENGVELRSINLNEGEGNFHLMPNGVFYIDEGAAYVTESKAFEELRQQTGLTPRLAVQSGPQLVIENKIHPAFSLTSESRYLRNGVGVTEAGTLFFLNTNEPVTLWEFATEFQDRGAVNALYLDGSISRMEPVTPGQAVPFNIPFAGMLVLTE